MISRVKRDFLTKILNVAWGFLLSGTVRIQDLPYHANSTSITDFRDLHCDFTRACRWKSEGNTPNSWGWASGEPDKFVWLAATGTNIVPVEPFSLLSSRGSEGSDILVSDEVSCQDGDGLFEFNYWITSGAIARVCALNHNRTTEIFCSEALEHLPTPGKAEITVPGPIDIPFKLAIIAGGEGFIVVDDLRYAGKPCVPGQSPDNKRSGEEGFSPVSASVEETDPSALAAEHGDFLLSLSVHRFMGNTTQTKQILKNVDDLICDFSAEWPCKWDPINKPEDINFAWAPCIAFPVSPQLYKRVYTIDGKLNEEAWERKTGTGLQPILPAGFLKHGSGGIASPIIPCQTSDGQIFMRWWVSPKVSVEVCAVSITTGKKLVCSGTMDQGHEDYPGPTVVDFQDPIHQSFVWHIIPNWKNAENGFVILDELSYFADICEPRTAVLKPSTGSVESSIKASTKTISRQIAGTTTTPRTSTVAARLTEAYRPAVTTPPKGLRTNCSSNLCVIPKIFTTTTPIPFHRTTGRTKKAGTTEASWKIRRGSTKFYTPPPLRRRTTEFVPLLPPILPPSSNLCRTLNCDFNDGYCGYRTSPLGSTGWYHRSTPFGRPMSRLTDIRLEKKTGHFLGALLFPYYIAVVESPKFRVEGGGLNVLQFKYYRASAGATIKICFETAHFHFTTTDQVKRCRVIVPELSVDNARKWNEVRVMLLPGYTKFYLVAEHMGVSSGYAAVGIDDIFVKNC